METTTKKLYISVLLSPLCLYFEPYSALVKALGVLVVIDILTGLMSARKSGQDITSKSLFKKIPIVGLFLIALVAAKEASPLLVEFGIGAHQAGKWVCALYGVYELLSILENLGRLGLPVAKQLSEMLKAKLPEDIQKVINQESPPQV
jgi:toxin secretion/phage lysis holin